MLDFSISHILIVLIVALVVVGPKDLPRLMRTLGPTTTSATRSKACVPNARLRESNMT